MSAPALLSLLASALGRSNGQPGRCTEAPPCDTAGAGTGAPRQPSRRLLAPCCPAPHAPCSKVSDRVQYQKQLSHMLTVLLRPHGGGPVTTPQARAPGCQQHGA